jgi:3-deoxy-D-manno-octulosonate 8-phosphate phosphatase (KDO 8-P phosphatase)
VKLLILDIDGVMTDGKKYYGLDGMPFAKTYCDKDFTAIKFLKASGMQVCFLSGDNKVNENMAQNRNCDFYYARGRDKADFIEDFCKIYNVLPEDMAYVGDDLFDYNIMKSVGQCFCPSDASSFVLALCEESGNVIDRKAGQNVIARLVDILLDRKIVKAVTLDEIEALDKNEKF